MAVHQLYLLAISFRGSSRPAGSIGWPPRSQQMKMRTLTIAMFAVVAAAAPAEAQRRPSLIPPGWNELQLDPDTKSRKFVSPDGRAWLITNGSRAQPDLERDIGEVAHRQGEVITYKRRGRSWIAVSGYAGEQIFYRKSHLACDGRRWHHIEFRYPARHKARMDTTVTSIARRMTLYNDACKAAG